MTMPAETPPPLRRLFDRLDFAPLPKSDALGRLLAEWDGKRRGAIAPAPTDFDVDQADQEEPLAFMYRIGTKPGEYALMSGRQALEPLLGPCEPGSGLPEAPQPRGAARLRRLFEAVRQAGEPVLAAFTLTEHGHDQAVIEVLAAPLSDQGRTIDAILGGIAIRPTAASDRPHPHAPGSAASGPLVFALGSSRAFGEGVARSLHVPVAALEERTFEDGEHKTRPLTSVRNRDAYVIHSLYAEPGQSPNDKLCHLLFFIGALKEAGAARVTAVVPYLCYARKDRQTKPRDPVTTRYVAQLFEAVGSDRVITLEVHNLAAFQNAFRCGTEHLEVSDLFARHFAPKVGEDPVAVVSPDLGGAKRAEAFRERLEERLGRPVAKGFMDKQRSLGRVTGDIFAGDVAGRIVIIVDDMISTGTTMARVAGACRAHGAKRIHLAAAHGLLNGGAEALWREPAVDEVVVTDTVQPGPLDPAAVRGRLVTISAVECIAEAIRRCHAGGG